MTADGELDRPDSVLTVTDTTGQGDGRLMVDGTLCWHAGFQVRIRAATYPLGWAKAETLKVALAKSVRRRAVTVGSNSYTVHAVVKIGQVMRLGKDTPNSKRSLFMLNAYVSVEVN